MNFTKNELIDMVYVLGESDRNCAKRIYHQRYPDRRIPDQKSFEKLHERFTETGNVAYKKPIIDKRATDNGNQLSVILTAIEDPHVSQKKIAEVVGISRTSVRRILKQHQYHPYKIQLHQELKDTDFDNRMVFCNWEQTKLQQNPFFL